MNKTEFVELRLEKEEIFKEMLKAVNTPFKDLLEYLEEMT